MKYFYIICRDGQIIEIPFTPEAFKGATEQLVKKGLLAIKTKGATIPVIINSVDVTKIVDEENYNNYIFSAKPALYIQDGVWRDGKERRVVRYEAWKQKELDEKLKLVSGEEETTPEQQEKLRERLDDIRAELVLTGILKP